MAKIRRRYIFHGRVQGVGFRYRASYAAQVLDLTGWVRNEYDGSVLAELQGRPEEIDQIIWRLQQDRYIVIDDISRKKIPLEDDEREFRVRG